MSSSCSVGRYRTRLALYVLWLSFLGPLPGCGDDSSAPIEPQDLLYCDIANRDCQRAIYDSLAEMLGAEGFDRPAIRTISVEQHAEEVRSGLDLEDLSGEDAESRGLRLLGFIPEASESLTATQVDYRINQIAAYYSPRNRTITIIDRDYDDTVAQVLLAHELTHAIQDLQFGFAEVYSQVDTEDAVMGARSVIEGDAMHSEYAWAYEQLGYLPEEIDWDAVHDEAEIRARERASDPEVALIDSASSFPYSYGFDFMTALTLSRGLAGRAAAFASPPFTAVQVMAGYEAPISPFDFPDVAHPAPVDGYSPQSLNRYGAWYVFGVLRRRGVEEGTAWSTALSWVGDDLAIYAQGSEVAVVWRVRLNGPSPASFLAEELNANAGERRQSAVVYENDVFVLAAESDEALLAWAEQPLDSTMAGRVLKGAGRRGGAVSAGNCMRSLDFSLPNPPPLLRQQ